MAPSVPLGTRDLLATALRAQLAEGEAADALQILLNVEDFASPDEDVLNDFTAFLRAAGVDLRAGE
jgi:hypothetical protein